MHEQRISRAMVVTTPSRDQVALISSRRRRMPALGGEARGSEGTWSISCRASCEPQHSLQMLDEVVRALSRKWPYCRGRLLMVRGDANIVGGSAQARWREKAGQHECTPCDKYKRTEAHRSLCRILFAMGEQFQQHRAHFCHHIFLFVPILSSKTFTSGLPISVLDAFWGCHTVCQPTSFSPSSVCVLCPLVPQWPAAGHIVQVQALAKMCTRGDTDHDLNNSYVDFLEQRGVDGLGPALASLCSQVQRT